MALRRIGANHRDDPLLLAVLQQSGGSGPFFLIESTAQSALGITMSDLSNGLWCQSNELGDARSTDSFRQLQKRHPAQRRSNRLDAPAQELLQCLLILLRDFNA
jgi:hypothetical protein